MEDNFTISFFLSLPFVLVEEAERQRIALTEKYDSQVKALRQELAQLRGQLEAEKQAVAVALQEGELTRQEDAKNAEARSEEVVHSLRREMEVFNCFALAQNLYYKTRLVRHCLSLSSISSEGTHCTVLK